MRALKRILAIAIVFLASEGRGDADAPGELDRVAPALSKASKIKLDRAVKKFADEYFVEE